MISRREAFFLLCGVPLLGSVGCVRGKDGGSAPGVALPNQVPDGTVGGAAHADDVAAVCDVLLPTERDASGNVVAPGAFEADVDAVLRITDFVALGTAQGLIPPLPDADVARFSVAADALRDLANAELAVLAARHTPLTAFRDLPRDVQETIVSDAFADDAQKSLFTVLRAATMLAFLGAVTNDLGLQYVGFPEFENFADGLAVSGYPRMTNGQPDDYTYNRAPALTASPDPLLLILDVNGDLL